MISESDRSKQKSETEKSIAEGFIYGKVVLMTALIILLGVLALGPLAIKFGADTTPLSQRQQHHESLIRRGWWPGQRNH